MILIFHVNVVNILKFYSNYNIYWRYLRDKVKIINKRKKNCFIERFIYECL